MPLTLSAAMLPPGASPATVTAVVPDTLCAQSRYLAGTDANIP
ncbi:hypothetical protein [Xanthomonas oryzae]|nr:hypothetical protein [Xanthomonas oryzae]